MEHLCTACLSAEEPPSRPRPIKWTSDGGRIRLCYTCLKAREAAERASRRTARVTNKFGISYEDQVALWEYQGERCPCGRKPRRAPDSDHNHKKAREQCSHDEKRACVDCFRGFTCHQCNQVVLGRYTSAQLRALAAYLDDPPYQAMRRERNE